MAELKRRRMKFYHFWITVFFIFCSISLICFLNYFYFVLFRDFSITHMRIGVQYRSSYAPNYTQLTLQQLRNRIVSSLL